jgi:hypothetical protein
MRDDCYASSLRENAKSILVFLLLSFLSEITMAADLTTPERALKTLEDAYIRMDLDGAVAAKDFQFEATAMLGGLKSLKDVDEALIRQAAEVLEMSFRKQIKTEGFPNFSKLRCAVVEKKQLQPDLVAMIEECIFPDGRKSGDTIHARRSENGWRIVVLPSS